MTVREALNAAAARLTDVSSTPRLDAEILMAQVCGTDRETMLLSGMAFEAPAAFQPLLDRRMAGEPVAYITGRRAFWTIELEVGPGALIPRPDSETLIEAALDHFGTDGPETILDLGTGPGTLLLAALDQWPRATGLGVDASQTALTFASRNANRLGFSDRAEFRQGDWCEGLERRFDIILCNPPYVEAGAELPRDVVAFEPALALFAGEDGLDAYRRLAPHIGGLLNGGGIACIEIGAGQEADVRSLLDGYSLRVRSRSDLGGHVRCLVASHLSMP